MLSINPEYFLNTISLFFFIQPTTRALVDVVLYTNLTASFSNKFFFLPDKCTKLLDNIFFTTFGFINFTSAQWWGLKWTYGTLRYIPRFERDTRIILVHQETFTRWVSKVKCLRSCCSLFCCCLQILYIFKYVRTYSVILQFVYFQNT